MNNTNESTRAIPILEQPIIQRTLNSFVSVANETCPTEIDLPSLPLIPRLYEFVVQELHD